MNVGRRVMEDLYEIAGMEVPSFFPSVPIDKVVDGNGLDWLALLNNGDASWKVTPQRELHIRFPTGADGNEVRRLMDLIPENLGPKRLGTKIHHPSSKGVLQMA